MEMDGAVWLVRIIKLSCRTHPGPGVCTYIQAFSFFSRFFPVPSLTLSLSHFLTLSLSFSLSLFHPPPLPGLLHTRALAVRLL